MQLTLDCSEARSVSAALRREHPQLQAPLVLPCREQPVLALDRERHAWLFGLLDRDPQRTARGDVVLPRRELRRLRELARLGMPFQALGSAHEVDPRRVAPLLPALRDGPRTCTDAVARALVGPAPAHPAALRTTRTLDALVGRAARLPGALATGLDPIIFGIVGLPESGDSTLALWFPLVAWRW